MEKDIKFLYKCFEINVSRIFLEKEKIQLLQDGFPVEG